MIKTIKKTIAKYFGTTTYQIGIRQETIYFSKFRKKPKWFVEGLKNYE